MIAEDILDAEIKSKRLSHAYLFLGCQKEIMEKCALKFAKALNCLKQTGGLTGCEECISCKKIEHFNHPDIGHIHAEGISRQIKIEQIRNLRKDACLKPIEARKKVYIIYDADSMTEQASNCLLKTIEEPPKNVIIILIGSNLSSILPTIVSRCQIIKFHESKYAKKAHNEEGSYIDEFLNIENRFSSETLEFIKRPKSEQLKTVDLLLTYFRDMLVGTFPVSDPNARIYESGSDPSPENILILMKELLKSKELLQSNVNSKLVADYILGSIISLKSLKSSKSLKS